MNNFSKNSIFIIFLILVLVAGLHGCAAPGAPMLRKNTQDGHGPLIPNCQNILPSSEIMFYETAFYHSTWSSVFGEGLQVGVREGLKIDNENREFVRFKKEFAYQIMLQVFGIDGRNYPFPPFCMKYDAPLSEVTKVIDDILPALGNPIVRVKEERRLLGTEFYDRSHISARWRDRYIINIGETTSNETVVTVFRELYISRGKEGFARAESDGHNEAWILNKVRAALK